MKRQPYPASLPDLTDLPFTARSSTHCPLQYIDGILTQWDFHRVQEHQNRSSDEEVMTFQSWRSHMNRQPYPTCPISPFRPAPVSTILHRHMDGILTQWDFHRVKEHPNRISDEEVMTFRSWMSHMNRQPYPATLPDLTDLPFLANSSTHCPPHAYGWNLDSMGFS